MIMKDQLIIKNYDPFPFLEIENMYDDDQLKLIWQELEFLNQSDKFKSPEETGSAEKDGKTLKKKLPIQFGVAVKILRLTIIIIGMDI